MKELTQSIEAVLFATAEPQQVKKIAERLNSSEEEVLKAVTLLKEQYSDHGIMVVVHEDTVMLASRPEYASIIESIRKEELSKELTKASAETLAIIAYWPGVSKAEIEFIRGVNASYTLRSLMMRGLIENRGAGRSVAYYPTIEVLGHFGISHIEELPDYAQVQNKLKSIMKEH